MVESHACVVHSSVGVSLVGIRVKGGKNTEIKAKTRRNLDIPPLGTKSYRSHRQLFGSCIPELPEGSCCCVSRTFLLGLNIYPGEPGEERELESQGWV